MSAIVFQAYPQDGFIALRVPKELIPAAKILAKSDGVLLRIKTADDFRKFMLSAMEHAALVWPDISWEWNDGEPGAGGGTGTPQ